MKKIPSILKATGRARLGMAEQARRPLKERPHVVSGYTTFSPYDAFRQKRPPTAVDLILAYRNFVFWAANTVAAAVAAVPHRLYAIQRHGRKAGRFRTKALGRAQIENLHSDHTLAKKLATAAKVEEITEHPYLDLISHVNPWMTTFSLFELMSLYLETVGGSYWSFVRGFGGLPVEIWPLPSWLVYVEPDYQSNKVVNRYVFTSGGRQTIFEPSEILYIRRTSLFDPYTQGWSPLRACYEQTEFSDKLIEYDESRLSNMSRPDAVMEATDEGPIGWEETQRVNNDFRQNFAMSGAGGLWVAPGGTTLKAMEWPGFDPVAGERAKATLYGIARSFDIPSAMVDSTGTSRANLDATLLEFSRRAVMPRCRRIEEEINSNLMPLYSDDIFIAFDTAVPADKVLERETHAAYISAGVMSRNEARLELGLAPVDGGDELLVSNSLVPLSHAIDPPAPVIPGRVQGAEPDEVPTAATTPESSEREEPADDADDGEFAEGEDLEASTDEPAEKAFDPDAAGAIPDAAVVKALRVIDLIHERLAAEGEDEREDGHRPFRRAIGKHNPCHDADGQFCSHGGGGAHGIAAFRAGGEDVSPGRVEALKSAVAQAGKARGADWTLEVSGPRDDRERRASARAEAADRFLVEKTSAPKVAERVEGERRLHVVGGKVEAETFPAPDGKGWVSRDHHPQSPEERRFRTEEQALARSRKYASIAAKEDTTREHATPKDIDKYVSEQASERLLVGGRFTSRLDDAETHATTFRLIVPGG